MKKFYLFSLGLLVAAPMFAQDLVIIEEGPTRTQWDAEEIFFQGFEADWNEFQTQVIDTLDTLYYYKQNGGTAQSISSSWPKEFVMRTDSVILMRNGVMATDNKLDVAANTFADDEAGTVRDVKPERAVELLEKFGIDAGQYYFRYKSATPRGGTTKENAKNSAAYSNGVTANYRRNLFVRGIPVKDNSSYRLTLFLKVNQDPDCIDVVPTFYADVMKGYFHSEKPFYTGNSTKSSYSTTYHSFEYKQTHFTGNWEKVTFMTYYLNDSIQQAVYNSAYYWPDDWTWKPKEKIEGIDSMNYILQPNKYFVRLSFASDSTEYLVDNISLTKSWIGGVEYYGDKIRVDFGYATNLKELADAQLASTNISAVALDSTYFTVLGHYTDDEDPTFRVWVKVPIRSAEYQGDGYMYMWTQPDEDGSPTLFDIYDTVLVSFKNPVDDPSLCLKYTDNAVFPKADDKEWVEAGKKVPDFYNEIATLNPYVFDNVYSMMDRPPVLQKPQFENGSFGLDGSIRTLTLKMSRYTMIAPNATEQTDTAAWCRVTGPTGKEVWPSVSCDDDGNLVFKRPDDNRVILEGAYKFEFFYLKDYTTTWGTPFTLEYEFGEFSKNPSVNTVVATDFKSCTSLDQAVPSCLSIWNSVDGFRVGDGTQGNPAAKSRLYYCHTDQSLNGFDCGMYVSGRDGKVDGHLFYGLNEGFKLHLAAGSYMLSFYVVQWNQPTENRLYIYKNTFGAPADVQSLKESDKTLFATFTPQVKMSNTTMQTNGVFPKDAEYKEIPFSVTEEADYVIELWVANYSTNGDAISNITITTSPGMSYPYVSALNRALADVKDQIAVADSTIDGKHPFYGVERDEANRLVAEYDEWKGNRPSEYDSITAAVNTAVKNLTSRIDTVGIFYTSFNAIKAKQVAYSTGELKDYAALEDVAAINDLISENSSFDCSEKTGEEIVAAAKEMDDAVKALDARQEIIGQYNEVLASVKTMVDNAVDKTIDKYIKLKEDYDYFAAVVVTDGDDNSFAETFADLCAAKKAYLYKEVEIAVNTRQIKELFALADTLGSDFAGRKDSIKSVIDNLEKDDADLQTILRECIKLEIYKKLANGEVLDSLPLDVLIPNYFFLSSGKDMVEHDGNWVFEKNTTNAVPYWNIEGIGGSTAEVYPGFDPIKVKDSIHAVINGLRVMSQTQISSLKQTVKGLPAGIYNVSVYIDNYVSNTKMSVNSNSMTIVKNGQSAAGMYRYAGWDDIVIGKDADLVIDFNFGSGSGTKVQIDHMALTLRGAADVDYKALASEQLSKINGIVTFADAPSAQVANVKFFNMSGIEIAAPQAGQFVIMQTIGADGSIATEKVLVK